MQDFFVVEQPKIKASTDTDILCLQITMCLYALAIPILLYFTWRYSKFRTASCIKPRRPNITIYVEFIVLCMFMNRILLCANGIYYKSKILRIIFIITYAITNHSALWICSVKYWLLYYDIQFMLHSEGNQWKTHINRHNITYHTNWYILNKSTVGNESYLLKKVSIVILFPSIIIPIFDFIIYTTKYNTFIDLFLMIIPLVLTTIIWYKTPAYLDYFRVREECRMLVIIGSVLIILYLILGFISTFFMNTHSFFIVSLCIEYIYLFGVFIAAAHLTFWTMEKNKHRLYVNQKHSKLYLHYRTLNRTISNRTKINKTKTIKRRLSSHIDRISQSFGQNEAILLLISILENEHGFQMFLSHILTEFCLESMLAIIEFTQYQTLMKDLYNSKNEGTGDKYQLNTMKPLILPNIIPQSTIVYDPKRENEMFDITIIATKLLRKYIVDHGQFEINISYKLKKKLLTDLNNINELNEIKLIHLFDESIQSLLFLLNDSLARFVKTPKYKQIEKELAEEFVNDNNDNNSAVINVNSNNRQYDMNKQYVKVETPATKDSPRENIILPANDVNIDDENIDEEREQTPIMNLPTQVDKNDEQQLNNDIEMENIDD